MISHSTPRPKLTAVPTDFERVLGDLSDAGNADFLVSRIGEDLLYQHDRGKWRYWDGTRWVLDNNGEVMRRAENVIRDLIHEAADYDDTGSVKKLLAHAQQSLNARKFAATLEMAESKLPVSHDQFDVDNSMLGVANGIVNLKTGRYRLARRDDRLTRTAGAAYVEGAKAPQWERFLDRIFNGDAELIAFIQRAIGYSLTGHTSEQCFFLLVGGGANGKSVLLSIVDALLGDYSMTTPVETFLETRGDRPSNDLAAMNGARFVSASEPDENRRLASGRLKMLCGEDKVTCRYLRQEHFTYVPRFKAWLASNHKPVVNDASYGMWRRVRLIPFNVTIAEKDRDSHLRERIVAEELSGILNWAIAGAVEWHRNGLRPPAAVIVATDNYRQESDRVGEFIEERCELGPTYTETSARLYEDFSAWVKSNGEEPLRQKAFGARLDQHGITSRRTNTARQRIGIRLKSVTRDAW